ncbi:ECF-type riboflavin transporter substrate-binding protein [Paenibacillus sp. NPDC058174]|uniref:ECF-type riboflavin transporter substrate-binding protein n=1 Tax=Paenibacillus sp. NPDC058174 TaxID=3346366 RepID=UPI0036DD72B7
MAKRNGISISTIVAVGIGSPLFVILGRFGSIPSGLPDTNIETTYALLALIAVLYGPIAGVLVGLIGHTLKDAIFYGSPWFSWVIASAVVGLIIGLASGRLKIEDGQFGGRQILKFNLFQIAANVIAWLVVAPFLDILIYAEPVNKVFAQGVVAGGSNIAAVGVIGTLLLLAYSRTRTRQGSLTKEV